MPASCIWSARSSMRVISSATALMRAALLETELEQGHRLDRQLGGAHDDAAHLDHRRLEARDLEQGDRLGGLLHLVDGVVEEVISSLMSPRSKGVMKLRRTASSTSRVMASAASS